MRLIIIVIDNIKHNVSIDFKYVKYNIFLKFI